jgi:hypothetical protein
MMNWLGVKVYSRDGKTCGTATGATRPCQMEGCKGQRVSVKWSDGKHSFPCSRGMRPYKKGFRII